MKKKKFTDFIPTLHSNSEVRKFSAALELTSRHARYLMGEKVRVTQQDGTSFEELYGDNVQRSALGPRNWLMRFWDALPF